MNNISIPNAVKKIFKNYALPLLFKMLFWRRFGKIFRCRNFHRIQTVQLLLQE